MDSALIPKGVKRCPTWQFAIWIGLVSVVLLWGVYAMLLCWIKGLNQTNMNNALRFCPLDLGRSGGHRIGRRRVLYRIFALYRRQGRA